MKIYAKQDAAQLLNLYRNAYTKIGIFYIKNHENLSMIFENVPKFFRYKP